MAMQKIMRNIIYKGKRYNYIDDNKLISFISLRME